MLKVSYIMHSGLHVIASFSVLSWYFMWMWIFFYYFIQLNCCGQRSSSFHSSKACAAWQGLLLIIFCLNQFFCTIHSDLSSFRLLQWASHQFFISKMGFLLPLLELWTGVYETITMIHIYISNLQLRGYITNSSNNYLIVHMWPIGSFQHCEVLGYQKSKKYSHTDMP